MESINEMAVLEVLSQLQSSCPALAGAVVATRDGLVLAAIGDYQGDTPAACAASLSVHLQGDLQPLTAAPHDKGPQELLIFGDNMLWYLGHLTAGNLLLVGSRQPLHAGAVRMAGQVTARQLNRWLATNQDPS